MIFKGPHFPRHPSVSTEKLDPGTHFHLDSRFFNKVSCQNNTSALNIVDATTIHLFGYPTIWKRPPLQLINNFIQFSRQNLYKSSIFRVGSIRELSRSLDLM